MFSASPLRTDIPQCSRHVRFVPILLQKSKIERRQKSREGRILDVSLQRSVASIRWSVVVFVRNNVVPRVATYETHQRSQKISLVTQKGFTLSAPSGLPARGQVTLADAALHHNFKWGASVGRYAALHALSSVSLLMLAVLWGTFYTVIPLFNGRRDREIAHALPATLSDFWFGHF